MDSHFKKAHSTHPELKATPCLPLVGIKGNPASSLYTTLGIVSKGAITEVKVRELGLMGQGGKVTWGKTPKFQKILEMIAE